MTGFAAILAHKEPVELSIMKVEVFLGVFIGAVTFTGSVVAFGKLAGKVDGKAKKLPGGHFLNAGATLLSLVLLVLYVNGADTWPLLVMTLAAFFIGYHLITGIGGADMPVVVSMLNSYAGDAPWRCHWRCRCNNRCIPETLEIECTRLHAKIA